MKSNFSLPMVIIVLGLCIAVIVLFSKNSKLEDQLTTLNLKFEKNSEKKNEELNNLETNFISQTKQFEDELIAQMKQAKDSSTRNENHFAKLDKDVLTQKGQIESIRELSEQQQRTLASFKDDVAKGVQSALTKKVLNAAVEMSVKNMMHNKTLIDDEKFQKSIAHSLVTNFREELRGVAGTNADNAVVASTLKKDQEFLDLVSVSVLMRSDSKPVVEGE